MTLALEFSGFGAVPGRKDWAQGGRAAPIYGFLGMTERIALR
jgi:hypothetical protein